MGAIFESIMLICFGLSWPLNVIKAYKARTTKGSSLPFILLIVTGYIAGITAKIITYVFGTFTFPITKILGCKDKNSSY